MDEPYLGATLELDVFMENIRIVLRRATPPNVSFPTNYRGRSLYHPLGKPIQWLQEELTQACSPKLGWLRVATNQALQQGTERATLIQLPEKETLSQTHPAVCEKLADLYPSVNRTRRQEPL